MKRLFLLTAFCLCLFCENNGELPGAGDNAFHGFIGQDLITLDPQMVYDISSYSVARQIYEGLAAYSPESMRLTGLLAESWEFSDGGKKLKIVIRDNVYFHDNPCFPGGKGRKLTAQDVKYSFERNHSRTNPGRQFVSCIEGYAEGNLPGNPIPLQGIRVIDKRTLEITFINPTATFFPSLDRSFGYIVPKEAVDYYGDDFYRNPVGTGPFVLEKWENNGDVILKKNPHYWQKDENGAALPYLDWVELRLMKSPILRLTEFVNKKLDVLDVSQNNFSVVFQDTSLTLNSIFRESGCTVVSSPYSFSTTWLLYVRKSMVRGDLLKQTNINLIWNNRNLRQALNYAIDRETIVSGVIGNWAARPAKGEFPPGINAYNPGFKGYYYNPAKAAELLRNAGFPNGKGLKPLKIVFPEGIINSHTGKMIQLDLKNIGVESEIVQVPYSEKSEYIKNNSADLTYDGWTLDYPDAMNFFEPSAVSTPRDMAQKIFFEVDPGTRTVLLQQWEKMFVDQCWKIYLYHRLGPIRIVQNGISGYFYSPMLYEEFKTVRKN